MIIFDKVNFSFDGSPLLSDFCDSFADGKINCVLGPSGGGKTTLLNLIAGLLTPQSGAITGGAGRVSYVFQDSRLIPQKTGFANLDFILKTAYPDKAERRRIIDEYLTIAGLYADKDKYPHEFSGGMSQRLSLIRAFAYPSGILLMDEPFKGLDPALKADIVAAFLTLWEKERRTVLFVTHEANDALLVGDNVHIYTDKPLTLRRLIEIPREALRRKPYDPAAESVKRQI
jgi:NitT/TauT family transport system ATP-binding protein